MVTEDVIEGLRWKDLTMREGNVLEHLFGIMTGRRQRLVVEAGERPVIQRVRHNSLDKAYAVDVPKPTRKEVDRMKRFLDANRSDYAEYSKTEDGFEVLPNFDL